MSMAFAWKTTAAAILLNSLSEVLTTHKIVFDWFFALQRIFPSPAAFMALANRSAGAWAEAGNASTDAKMIAIVVLILCLLVSTPCLAVSTTISVRCHAVKVSPRSLLVLQCAQPAEGFAEGSPPRAMPRRRSARRAGEGAGVSRTRGHSGRVGGASGAVSAAAAATSSGSEAGKPRVRAPFGTPMPCIPPDFRSGQFAVASLSRRPMRNVRPIRPDIHGTGCLSRKKTTHVKSIWPRRLTRHPRGHDPSRPLPRLSACRSDDPAKSARYRYRPCGFPYRPMSSEVGRNWTGSAHRTPSFVLSRSRSADDPIRP